MIGVASLATLPALALNRDWFVRAPEPRLSRRWLR